MTTDTGQNKKDPVIECVVKSFAESTSSSLASCQQEKRRTWSPLKVFKGQWPGKVKKLIQENQGKMVPVPHNMTSYFRPLDLQSTQSCKSLRSKAQTWCAEKVPTDTDRQSYCTGKGIYQYANEHAF